MAQQLGPYLLEAELGRGGMGVVWRAHDPALDRTVAIKVLLTAFAGPDDLVRFRREALAQARLRHPAIVGVHTAGSTPTGQPYLVMDHVEGESLAQRVQRGGPLAPLEAARVVATLARGVQYAHARGVLHRDLKARNVLLDAAGEPILIDFGLAALAGRERLTATGEVVGTPGCMAPEQAVGDRARVGPKSDVYGLGAVLHEALTGRPPFEGRDVMTVLAAVVEQPATPPSLHRPGVDPRLDALVLRCLEKDPARRFASAEALADALDAFAPRGGRRPAAVPAGSRAVPALLLLALGAGVGALAGRALALPAAPAPAAATPAPTASLTVEGSGAAAAALVRSGDLAGARALADAALASPAGVDLSQALVARAVARHATDPTGARSDIEAALALDRSVGLLAQRCTMRLLEGELPGAREDLAELGRSTDPRALVYAARTLVLAEEPGALEAAEAAAAATAGLDGAATAKERWLRARALGARAYARCVARLELEGADADAAGALAIQPEPLALLTVLARSERGEAQQERLGAALAAATADGDGLAMSVILVLRARASTREAPTAAQLRSATDDLDRAATLAPGSKRVLGARARLHLGLLQLTAGAARRKHADAALRDAERLARVTDDEPDAVDLVARLHGELALDPAGLDAAAGARAVAVLTRGLARRPDAWALLVGRADLRAALGDLDGAEADAAAVVDARASATDEVRARVIQARLRWRRGAVKEALAVLELAPRGARSPHLLAERAVCRALDRDAAGALADAEEAIQLSSRLARAHYALARAHRAGGDAEAARAALEATLQRDPGLAVALAERATLRPERDRQALADLEAALRLEPWAQEHRVELARRLSLERDPARADAELDRALALDPACCSGRLLRGTWRLGQRRDSRGALADLSFVTELNPRADDAWSLLAVARQQVGDAEGALAAAERCLELLGERPVGPGAARALRVQAAALHARGDHAGALAAADRAVAADPDELEGLTIRAQVRTGDGDLEGALVDLDEALRRQPKHHRARLDRAVVWLLRGEKARAHAEVQALLPSLEDPALALRAQELLRATRP